MKRFFDITLAIIALVALAPLFALCGAAIFVTDGPPIAYRGLRIGQNGRIFHILKFRTMVQRSTHHSEITVGNDSRVTPIGRLLRASKLDELPQLINVLRGEMSLVGPRPESPHFVAHYTPQQRMTLAVRPGITGPSQVTFRHEEHLLVGPNPEEYYRSVLMPAKLAIDLQYVRHQSFWLDLKIVVLTLLSLVRPISLPILLPQRDANLHDGVLSEAGIVAERAREQRGTRETAQPPGVLVWLQTMQRGVSQVAIHRIRAYGVAVILDILVVTLSFETATVLRFIDFPINPYALLPKLQALLLPGCIIGVGYACVSYLLGLHRRLWRYASFADGIALMQVVTVAMLLVDGLDIGLPRLRSVLPLSIAIIGSFLSFLFLGCVKLLPRIVYTNRSSCNGMITRVLIVGAGREGAALAARFLMNGAHGYRVEAFVDDDPAKWGRCLYGKPIVGPTRIIADVVQQLAIDLIAIALPSEGAERISQIIALCQETPASIKILQELDEIGGRQKSLLNLREVNIADLLGREVVPLQTAEARSILEGKTLLVTGAAGSIGSVLCEQLLNYSPAKIIALDINETGLFDLAQSLRTRPNVDRLHLRIGDITDEESMARLFAAEQPHIVFHVAAYKHVPLLEEHPDQAVHTNVLGTYHLCLLARQYQVERFVFISSDKAADPVNVLGASKRLGELTIQGMTQSGSATRFCAVRFGNVIGSRGSVVPTFALQIEQGGPITVTDPKASRYFMTISEACGLIILTATIAESGGLFLLDMGDPVLIRDLAVKMIRARGLRVGQDVRIVYTGMRPGERLHETLSTADEELVPTAYKKILQLTPTGEQSDLATINRWMEVLQKSLKGEDWTTLRARLFECIETRVSA